MSIGRTIAGLLGVGFLAVSVWTAIDSRRLDREFREAWACTLGESVIDFSHLGGTRIPFNHTYPAAHGIWVYLILPESPQAAEDGSPASCRGFFGDLSITNTAGTRVWSGEIRPVMGTLPPSGPEATTDGAPVIELAKIDMPLRGEYTLTVDVRGRAGALAGVPQRLEARYRMCGLEKLPAVVMTGAAVVSGVLALVCGAVWVAGRRGSVAEGDAGGAA